MAEASAANPALRSLVERLRALIDSPDLQRPDYDRDEFSHWLDEDEDCINTRHEVLQEEAITFTMDPEEGCLVSSGEWYDPFTDRTFSSPGDLHVDHVVALADAWRSGAWAWSREERDEFANDPANLNAIEAGENSWKSDLGPADYAPTNPAQLCAYLAQYAMVKVTWGLHISQPDFDAVEAGLAGCDSPAPATPTATPSASATAG